jgi:hypothetical protein
MSGACWIRQMSDGGYIAGGYTWSNDGDVSGNHGSIDGWVVKLNSLGSIVWQKCLGGTDFDYVNSIQQTSDGGYIVAAKTLSNNGNATNNHGEQDGWILKLNSSGSIAWQKTLGGSLWDETTEVQQTANGGYIAVGRSNSNDGNVSGNHGQDDCWILRLSKTGAIVWQQSLGGSGKDYGYSIEQTKDSGYIIAGSTTSRDGDLNRGLGKADYWIIKLSNGLSAISTQAITLSKTVDPTFLLTVRPNPTKQDATLTFEAKELYTYTIKVTNTVGEQLKVYKGATKLGKNEASINLGNYPKGTYIITLIDGKNRTGSQMLIKE